MSTEPTPENLRRQAVFVAMGDDEGAECLRRAADLIESQQARIATYERILCELWADACSPYVRGLCAESVEAWDADGLAMADVLARNEFPEVDGDGEEVEDDDELERLLAASPDTPETRP